MKAFDPNSRIKDEALFTRHPTAGARARKESVPIEKGICKGKLMVRIESSAFLQVLSISYLYPQLFLLRATIASG